MYNVLILKYIHIHIHWFTCTWSAPKNIYFVSNLRNRAKWKSTEEDTKGIIFLKSRRLELIGQKEKRRTERTRSRWPYGIQQFLKRNFAQKMKWKKGQSETKHIAECKISRCQAKRFWQPYFDLWLRNVTENYKENNDGIRMCLYTFTTRKKNHVFTYCNHSSTVI